MYIEKIKQAVGQQAENIIAQALGLSKSGKKYRCPNYSEHKNGDRNPSMSWDPKALQFYCFACGEKIDIYKYYKEYQNKSHAEILSEIGMIDKQQVKKIEFKLEPLTDDQSRYLEDRGIVRATQKYFNVGNINGNIGIPYFENGNIKGIKIRNLKTDNRKYFSVTGSDFGLFNKEGIVDKFQLIISEGEFDAMILWQCGFQNVVSVGTGANALSKLWETEKSWLDQFESLIVISDMDEAGAKMRNAFLQAFGDKVKLPNDEFFGKSKDLNDVFIKYGREQIERIIGSAAAKIEGLRNLDNKPYKGIETLSGKYIPTGLLTIDIALNDLAPGLVTLITGRSNGGKSTLVNQIIANAIEKENKVLLIAGEGIQEITINNLYKAVIGRDESCYDYKLINKRKFIEPKLNVLKALQLWHKGKLTLFNKGDSKLKTTDELFRLMSMEIKTNRHNLIVIDNLMSVLSVERASEKLERQADFMQRLCDISKSEKVHIILVLHPNKSAIKGSNMEFEQISGTQDLSNKADNIISIKRNYEEEDITSDIDGEIEILKNRYFPDLKKIKVHYDKDTGTLQEVDPVTGDYFAYSFKWRKYLDKE